MDIDTDPVQAGWQGLVSAMNADEVVREINMITYALFNEQTDPDYLYHTSPHPVLKRKYNEENYDNVCEDIEQFQIIPYGPPHYQVHLIARTAKQVNYLEINGYAHTEFFFTFKIENSVDIECAIPATPSISDVTGLDADSPCEILVRWSALTDDVNGNSLSDECAVTKLF
ncbi:MAG: hypothetical protein ACMUIP_04165 [bacterium]